MNQLKNFNHLMFGDLPVLIVNGVEWFGAAEVAKALSFSNPRDATKNHVEKEDVATYDTPTIGGTQMKNYVNESGMYDLIFGAAKQGKNREIKEKAKKFKKWVTSEVLPSIRKHGAYMTTETIEKALLNPDVLIKIATSLKEEQEKRKAAEKVIEEQRPKVVYAEAVTVSEDTVLVKDLAITLNQKGIDIGEKRLFAWLRINGYLCKQKGDNWNMPTQRSLDLGIIVVKHGLRTGSNGEMKKTRTPKVTGKGQVYFVNKFLQQNHLVAKAN